MEFKHVSVLYDECIGGLKIKSGGIYVDGTLGGGGHASGICDLLDSKGTLIGIDKDRDALNAAEKRLQKFNCRKHFVQDNYSNIEEVLDRLGVSGIDGALLDLGVSSFQLDNFERGFSYMQQAPLDMRMNAEDSLTAEEVVNMVKKNGLSASLPLSQLPARKAQSKPLINWLILLNVQFRLLLDAEGPHPAKRTFQAIRIEVNGELAILRQALLDGVQLLRPGGRICVITFHSLEDRIVKRTFQELAKSCTCPPSFPICVCQTKPLLHLAGKAVSPSVQEVENNPRARSAKLRVAEKL